MLRSSMHWVFAVVFCAAPAFAIDIDRMSPNTPVFDVVGAGMVETALSSSAGVIGGTRAVQGMVTGVDAGSILTSRVFQSRFKHSQDTDTFGRTVLVYDGNANAADIDGAGLGGVDFTADDATSLIFEKVSSDHPFTITVTVYDANNPGAPSTFAQVYSSPVSLQDLEIPFTAFSPAIDFETVGAITVDIDGTGAASEALDASFGVFKTNGRCSHVPSGGLVVDECDVCDGDNSTCSDCLQVPNGPALPGTSCDTGDLGACATSIWTGTPPLACQCPDVTPATERCNSVDDDCDGQVDNVPGLNDSCSAGVGACRRDGAKVCSSGGLTCSATPGDPTPETCDGADNDCNGATDEGLGVGDSCLVGTGACGATGVKQCGSDGSVVCAAIAGTPGSETCNGIDDDCDGAVDEGFDLGGNCTVGTGACAVSGSKTCGASGGVVCVGAPLAPSVETCDGVDNDCDGDADEDFDLGARCSAGIGACASSGIKVCGAGGGASCSAPEIAPAIEVCDKIDNDCDGEIDEGVVDRCGVCGGDGTSCLGCTSVDISGTLFSLDGGAKEQEQYIVRSIQFFNRLPEARKHKKFLRQTRELAHVLQIKNWTLSWTLPQVSTQCANLEYCVSTSNTGIVNEYRAGNDRLLNLGLEVMDKIIAARKGRLMGREANLERLMRRQHEANRELASTVPELQTSCL